MASEIRKLYALYMHGSAVYTVKAVQKDGELNVLLSEKLTSDAIGDGDLIAEQVDSHLAKSYEVFLNFKSQSSTPLSVFDFNDKSLNGGVTKLIDALNGYYFLERSNRLLYQQKGMKITNDMVDLRPNDSGKMNYAINYGAIGYANFMLLMLCYVATVRAPTDQGYLAAYYGYLNQEAAPIDKAERLRAALTKNMRTRE